MYVGFKLKEFFFCCLIGKYKTELFDQNDFAILLILRRKYYVMYFLRSSQEGIFKISLLLI